MTMTSFNLPFLVFATSCLSCVVANGCARVTVDGTRGQVEREGVYTLSAGLDCNGRRVYEHAGDGYLYFVQTPGGWRGWMIGSNICSNVGGLAAAQDTTYPEDVSATWEEVYQGDWYLNPSITVRCTNKSGLSAGAIAGIVIGVVFAIIIIAVISCLCCRDNKRKNTVTTNNRQSQSQTQTSTSTVYYRNQRAFIQYPQVQAQGSTRPHYLGPPPQAQVVHAPGPGYPPPQGYSQAMYHGYAPPVAPPAYSSRPGTAMYPPPQPGQAYPSASHQPVPTEPPPIYSSKADEAYPPNVTD